MNLPFLKLLLSQQLIQVTPRGNPGKSISYRGPGKAGVTGAQRRPWLTGPGKATGNRDPGKPQVTGPREGWDNRGPEKVMSNSPGKVTGNRDAGKAGITGVQRSPVTGAQGRPWLTETQGRLG